MPSHRFLSSMIETLQKRERIPPVCPALWSTSCLSHRREIKLIRVRVYDVLSFPWINLLPRKMCSRAVNELPFVWFSRLIQILDVYCHFCLQSEFTCDLLSIWFAHLNSLARRWLAKRAISVGFPRILHSHSHLFLSESLLFFPTVSLFPLSPKHISLPPLLTELPPHSLILFHSDVLSVGRCVCFSPFN